MKKHDEEKKEEEGEGGGEEGGGGEKEQARLESLSSAPSVWIGLMNAVKVVGIHGQQHQGR